MRVEDLRLRLRDLPKDQKSLAGVRIRNIATGYESHVAWVAIAHVRLEYSDWIEIQSEEWEVMTNPDGTPRYVKWYL